MKSLHDTSLLMMSQVYYMFYHIRYLVEAYTNAVGHLFLIIEPMAMPFKAALLGLASL